MEISVTVASLRAAPGLLRALADVSSDQAWTPPKTGEWSIGEVARHLVEGERDTFLPRLRRMLTETRPVFESRRPTAGDASDLPTLVAAFASARTESVKLLSGIDAAGWAREGISPSRGVLSVEAYARTMAAHDTEHLGQVHDVREVLGLRPMRCEARRPLALGDLVVALRGAASHFAAVAKGLPAETLRRRPRDNRR
jgi:hypothetical protein